MDVVAVWALNDCFAYEKLAPGWVIYYLLGIGWPMEVALPLVLAKPRMSKHENIETRRCGLYSKLDANKQDFSGL